MKKNCIVILASTFPRWKNDSVPTFVYDHAINMKEYFEKVIVIAPHYKGAKKNEAWDGLTIKRFRYFWPASGENIAYGNFKSNNGFVSKIKSIYYIFSQVAFTLVYTLKFKPEIINAHWIIPQGFSGVLVGRLTKTKVISSVHGGDVFTLNGRFINKFKKYVLKSSDAVTVNSTVTERACRVMYNRTYKIIPPIVDVDIFKGLKKFDLNLKDKMLNILFVGRISEEKGIIYLLEAVYELVEIKGIKKIKVYIVGDGPDRHKLIKWVEEHSLENTITFEGWKQRSELIKYYALADVFVGPSIKADSGWVEAFGIVFAEASSAGIPIITTNTGGMVDIVKNGKNGYLVSQKNSVEISEKIQIFYNDRVKLNSFGKNGSKFVSNRFSSKVVSKKFNLLVEEII